MSSKQRKLKVGETSKHWNIKTFALDVKRKIDLHPKVFTVKKLLSTMSLSRYAVQLHRKALETLTNERSREIQSNCFQFLNWISFWKLLLLSEIWRKEFKSIYGVFWGFFGFYSGYIRKDISYFSWPCLTSVHSYKRTCIAPEVGSVRIVIFPCKISTIFPLQE